MNKSKNVDGGPTWPNLFYSPESICGAFLPYFSHILLRKGYGSEEKPQVRKGGATGASAGVNHTSARPSREERDGTPSAMLAAIGDLVHLLGLVSHPPPRSFHLLPAPAPTMESINASVWRHLSSHLAACLGEPDSMTSSLERRFPMKLWVDNDWSRWIIDCHHYAANLFLEIL